ncbi:Protein tyrosine phosphatase type IVA 1 [Dinochytrium kinnereticum]|nr:Protein tyrosine phosphatase type IVA 1 [Dinochytrium kinnereticum]
MTSIDYKSMRFVVFDCPTDLTAPMYLEELKLRNVTDIVRVCEPTYDKAVMEQSGVRVHDLPFPDGSIPSNTIITTFLHLCDERFAGGIAGAYAAPDTDEGAAAIGIHCVAGLGRAPVLVAMSLIEAGMTPLDAVEFVRKRRRGAFNSVQLSHLIDSYKRVWKKSGGSGSKFGGLLSSSSSSNGGNIAAGRPSSPLGKKGAEEATATPPMLRTRNSFMKVFGGFGKKT